MCRMTSMRLWLVFGFVLCAPMLSGIAWAVEYRLTAIDIPGVVSSRAFDINNNGQILVRFSTLDESGTYIVDGEAITQFNFPDFPGGGPISPAAMNNDGVFVGFRVFVVEDELPGISFTTTSFVFDREDVALFEVPGAGRTTVLDINDLGHIVGESSVAVRFGDPQEGFLYNGETFQSVVFPGATRTSVSGVNNLGQMVGTYGSRLLQGFVFDGNEFLPIDEVGDETWTPRAINDDGVIVGTHNSSLPFPRETTGFILVDGEFQTISFPGAIYTEIEDINNRGEIVGTYTDASGTEHAFFGTPVPEPGAFGFVVVAMLCLLFLRSATLRRQRHRDRKLASTAFQGGVKMYSRLSTFLQSIDRGGNRYVASLATGLLAATLSGGFSASAHAELIPINVVESSAGLDWTFSWQQDGAEELFLSTESEDWSVRLSVENISSEPPQWRVTADVYYTSDTFGIRLTESSGRVTGQFAADSFGDVLDAQGTTFSGLFDPNATQDPCFPDDCVPPMLDGGLLSLRVDEREGPLPSITSTIHVGADLSAVPEPSSGVIALAAIAFLLLLRVPRIHNARQVCKRGATT